MQKIQMDVKIPFMGDASFSATEPSQIASWIKEEDKIPLILALSLYSTPIQHSGSYNRIGNANPRFAGWFDISTGITIIGLKGTSVTGSTSKEDISDDTIIAGFGTSYCNLTLVNEASTFIQTLRPHVTSYIFVGHSLGGTAAFCLAQKFPNSRSISLNGGAVARYARRPPHPLSNPVLVGPGPRRARFYHVFGDLISTHMSPTAAEVVRIRKHDDSFGIIYQHSSSRILASDGYWTYATADQEDTAFLKWGKVLKKSS